MQTEEFGQQELTVRFSCNEGLAPEISPPRERKKPQTVDGRKFSWATQRIHDLEKELEQAKAKIKVSNLQQQS